jgi:uncharacterized membrane protein
MLSFMIMLAIASTVVELSFAARIPAWRRMAKKNKAFNMTISIGVSFLIGIMFGAGGLIAMSAAIISTVFSIPGYAFLEWAYDSPMATAKGTNLINYYIQRWKQVLADLMQLLYKVLRVITFPIWGTRNAIIKFNAIKSKYIKPKGGLVS